MIYPLFYFGRYILSAVILWGFLATALVAQTSDACAEGDCSPTLLSISLETSSSGNADPRRTEQFIAAYRRVNQIKDGHAQDPTWMTRYRANQLRGQSCLKLNQLESAFAYEYEQNTEFKKFIDQNEPDVTAWKENGFESSRRALNLRKRMEDNCPKEVKKMDQGQDLAQNVPAMYMKLGQVQGYFDDRGNLLKPLQDLSQPAPPSSGQTPGGASPLGADFSDLSKRQQIDRLKDQVNGLPVGSSVKDKVSGIAGALGAAKPKLGLLKGVLDGLKSRFSTLLPGPVGLLAKIKAAKDILSGLKLFKPKKPNEGLLSRIGDLFKKGEELTKQGEDLADKSKKLKDQYEQLTKDSDALQDEIDKRTADVKNMEDKLDELAKKKVELAAKLEDKPRQILDELTGQVADAVNQAENLAKKVGDEDKVKDQLLGKLDELTKAKDDVVDQMEQLEKALKELTKEQEQLEKDTKSVEKEVEEIKNMEARIEALKDVLDDLKPETKIQGEIALCKDDLKKLLKRTDGIEALQERLKNKIGRVSDLPDKLLSKLSDLKLLQNKLKLGRNGIPVADKVLAKIDGLLGKANILGSTVELLTGKKSRLQEKIEGFDKKLDHVKDVYEAKTADLDQLEKSLVALVAEKTGLKAKLDQAAGRAGEMETLVQDFIKRYNILDDPSKCAGKQEMEEKIKALEEEQAETGPELDKLEGDLKEVAQQEEQLERETAEVERETEENAQKAEELQQEETAIKEEYGTEVKLDPVPVEEWAESFAVERPYWDAVFHPDDEVVEGYKGRYFEVKLKDASKNVKLLFGPGEYYMSKSEFRKRYGTTIGAFVTEALNAMKKTDREKVKLFIQGSADIAGHNTFSGQLDQQFFFEAVDVLPQKPDEEERFTGQSVRKTIPASNFRNDHLPNLRARYLKEMISVYSKKFDPILLEGAVKAFQDEEERNAIIYLFLPEELLAEYGDN